MPRLQGHRANYVATPKKDMTKQEMERAASSVDNSAKSQLHFTIIPSGIETWTNFNNYNFSFL